MHSLKEPGMLASADVVTEVAKALKKYGKLSVIDPVCTASMPNVESWLNPYTFR